MNSTYAGRLQSDHFLPTTIVGVAVYLVQKIVS
nr:MAG TPA: hypothetical protein [Caudoviricetes sp.]